MLNIFTFVRLRHSLPQQWVRTLATGCEMRQSSRRLITYADYYQTIYRRSHLTYSTFFERIEQSKRRQQQAQQPPPLRPRKRRDPYQVLGVVPGSSQDTIKAAFRRRVWELHPDRQSFDKRGEADVAFREVSEAFRILSERDGAPQRARWPFRRRDLNQSNRPTKVYRSIFIEFMGVTRVQYEATLSHVARSVLCDRLVPRAESR